MIKCPNCSAELKFSAEKQKLLCEYCKSEFSPKELRVKIKESGEFNSLDKIEGQSYTCSYCGAELLTFDETAVTFCSYCGSQSIIKGKLKKINNPDFVIPFKKTKEECIKNYKKKLNRSFLAPSYMKKEFVLEKFRGIYMPYGVYKASFHGKASNSGSVYRYRRGDYVYYDDYDVKAEVDADYEGLSYDLSSKYRDDFSEKIPFDFHGAEPFNLNYLSGFYADLKDVREELYDSYVKEYVREDCNKKLRRKRQIRKYGCRNAKIPLKIVERKIGMFPVYFLAVKSTSKDRVHYAVVNGQTGDVTLDLPLDFLKYIILSLLLTIPIFFFLDANFVFKPKPILIFSCLMMLISIIISRYQIKKIKVHENLEEDIGLRFIKDNNLLNKKVNKGINSNLSFIIIFLGIVFIPSMIISMIAAFEFIKFSLEEININYNFILVPLIIIISSLTLFFIKKKKGKLGEYDFLKTELFKIIGLILSLIVFVINSPYDEVYYIASFLLFLTVILSFYDIVKKYNILSSRSIPQLEKRGGKNE